MLHFHVYSQQEKHSILTKCLWKRVPPLLNLHSGELGELSTDWPVLLPLLPAGCQAGHSVDAGGHAGVPCLSRKAWEPGKHLLVKLSSASLTRPPLVGPLSTRLTGRRQEGEGGSTEAREAVLWGAPGVFSTWRPQESAALQVEAPEWRAEVLADCARLAVVGTRS